MSTLESTIAMLEALPESDLIKIQDDIKRLFEQRSGSPFPLLSREDILRDLETSEQQFADGDYQEAGEFLAKLRQDYGL